MPPREDRPASSRETASLFRLVAGGAGAIVTLEAGRGGVPFYCIHSIAGDIEGFDKLARALGSEQRVCAIQVPKARMTPAHATSVEALAQGIAAEIDAFQPTGALAVGGFSAGAIVALEVARRLAAMRRHVPLLVALDGAPMNSGAERRRADPRYLLGLLRNLPRWAAAEDLRDWSPRGLAQRLVNRFVFAPGRPIAAPAGAHTLHVDTVAKLVDRPEWRVEQRAFIRAMFNAMAAYVPAPYPGKVVLYETQAQPLTHLLQLGTVWAALARDLEIVPLPGKHPAFFRDERTVAAVAAHLGPRLAALGAAGPLEARRAS